MKTLSLVLSAAVTPLTRCDQTPPLTGWIGNMGAVNPMIHCTKPTGHADSGDAKHSWERD